MVFDLIRVFLFDFHEEDGGDAVDEPHKAQNHQRRVCVRAEQERGHVKAGNEEFLVIFYWLWVACLLSRVRSAKDESERWVWASGDLLLSQVGSPNGIRTDGRTDVQTHPLMESHNYSQIIDS